MISAYFSPLIKIIKYLLKMIKFLIFIAIYQDILFFAFDCPTRYVPFTMKFYFKTCVCTVIVTFKPILKTILFHSSFSISYNTKFF